MPVYRYKCCGEEWENLRRIEDRTNEPCPKCGDKAVIVITGTGRPQCYDYYSLALDAQITGPKQKRRIMKEKGVEER